jgi:polysaccharide pyruvyl transferase WcaK-like protein
MLNLFKIVISKILGIRGYKLVEDDECTQKKECEKALKEDGQQIDVAIIGPYAIHNFGDDLIGMVIAARLNRSGARSTIPGLSLANSRWICSTPSFKQKGAIKRASHVLIGGGHIFGEGGPKEPSRYLASAYAAVQLAQKDGKSITVTGIGAGPISSKNNIKLIKRISDSATAIGVRDSESNQFLSEEVGIDDSKITVGADVALRWPEELGVSILRNNLIGIQFDPRPYLGIATAEQYERQIGSFLEGNVGEIVFISNSSRPTQIFQTLDILAPTLNYYKLPLFLRHLGGLRAIFTSHLHLAIAAYANRIPCFSLYCKSKTKRFYDQIGRSDRAISVHSASTEDVSRLLQEAKDSSWTSFDEERLRSLKLESGRLLTDRMLRAI